MKEYDDSVNINVIDQKVPYKRERPSFKQDMNRKKNYSKKLKNQKISK